jgi:hypothetical protein
MHGKVTDLGLTYGSVNLLFYAMIKRSLSSFELSVGEEHHQTLQRLLASGAAVRGAGDQQATPVGGAEFQRAPSGWDLVWVELWPKNEYATHWQPFSRVALEPDGALVLSDDSGRIRTYVRPLDASALQKYDWDRWNGGSDEAESARYFVQDMLRLARRITGADDFAN